MHILQHHSIKHNPCVSGPQLYKFKVSHHRYICPTCGKIVCQQIPFKEENHNFTKAYGLQISHLLDLGLPINKVAEILHLSRACFRKMDYERLRRRFKKGKPGYQSRYLGVDEFSLHRNHEYATIVVDLETKDVLFVEKNKTEMQLHHFFDLVGNEYMSHTKSISINMNAQM
ncbi:MAG: transposase [Sphaerochaeta sp.]